MANNKKNTKKTTAKKGKSTKNMVAESSKKQGILLGVFIFSILMSTVEVSD